MSTTVGVRELKAHLSEYLERAAAGEEITVTDRGRPKVVLTGYRHEPVDESPPWPPRMLEMAAQGLVRLPARREPLGPSPISLPFPEGMTLQDWMDEDREDRF